MAAAVHLVLVRHGRSEWNLSGRFTGWTDIALSEQGRAQAAAAGRVLVQAGIRFDEVHTSVLRRTHQTADTLLAAMQHPPIPCHPRFEPLFANIPPEQLPRSESLRDCRQRLLPWWEEQATPALKQGKHLLVISHGNTLRSLVIHLDNIAPADVEKVEIPSGKPLVYRINEQGEVTGREWLDTP